MAAETITNIVIGSIILIGIVAVWVGTASLLRSSDPVGERMRSYFENSSKDYDVSDITHTKAEGTLARLRVRLNALFEDFGAEDLNHNLMSANWQITVIEFYLLRLVIVFVGFVLGWLLFQSPLSGFGLAGIAYLTPNVLLKNAYRKRHNDFQNQFIDVLVLISGAVKAGHSLLQSLDVVVEEMAPPASVEFQRVRKEIQLGLPLDRALDNLSKRMANDDLNLVITAININAQVGGNLTVMLQAVIGTIRERIRLFSEIRAITSYARYSGYLLTLLPIGTAFIIFLVNPEYMIKILDPGITRVLLITAIFGIIIGNIWLRALLRFKV